MRFLVLGASGQIGSALTPYLRTKGHQVVPFDIDLTESQDLRIQNNPDLYALSGEVDYVIFLAFDVGGSKYLSTAQYDYGFIQNNLSIMKTVFDFIKHTGLPLIFASSQMAGMLHSSYGNLKAIGEKAAISLGGSYIRFWNVYGIENDPLKSHVITDFVRQAIWNKRIEMLTDGSEVRDFLHVSDACEAIVRVAEIENTGGFDVASFEYTSILDVAKIIAEITGAEVVPGSLSDSVQSGHQFDPSPEILTWWRPQVSLQEGINWVLTEIAL